MMSEPTESNARPRNAAVRAMLWLLLVAAVAGNVGTAFGDSNPLVHLGFGIAGVLCAAALAGHYLWGRR